MVKRNQAFSRKSKAGHASRRVRSAGRDLPCRQGGVEEKLCVVTRRTNLFLPESGLERGSGMVRSNRKMGRIKYTPGLSVDWDGVASGGKTRIAMA